MNKKNFTLTAFVAVLTLLIAYAFGGNGSERVSAAPMAAPTPITYNNTNGGARLAPFFQAVGVIADTRVCFDLQDYDLVDLQYVIDQGTVNTVTLTMQYSNNNANFSSGAAVVSANAADADNLNQFHLFGRYNCVFADVTNTNPVTITVLGVVK